MTELSAPSSVSIPSAVRPSKSVIDLVKNTLSGLICSVEHKSLFDENESEEFKINQDKSDDLKKTDCESMVETKPIERFSTQRSKVDFQQRVKTFSSSLWCGKPLCLSPPLLAQYGWECVGEDVMKCCSCSTILAIRLPWPDKSNYKSECFKAQQKVAKGHGKICSWSSNRCNDSYVYPFNVQYMSKDDKQNLKKEFSKRANNLLCLGDKLPYVTADVTSDMNMHESTVLKLLKQVAINKKDAGKMQDVDSAEKKKFAIQTSATLLALCGWDSSCNSDTENPSISCNETARTVGLWNFHSIGTEVSDGRRFFVQPPAKKSRYESPLFIEKSHFHPVEQHHIWSPWVVALRPISTTESEPATQSTKTDDPPGWTVLLNLLLGSRSGKRQSCEETKDSKRVLIKTPPRAAVQQAMKMLKEWSSPHQEDHI